MGQGSSTGSPDEVIIDVNGEYHRRKSAAIDPNAPNAAAAAAAEAENAKDTTATKEPASLDEQRGFVPAKDDNWQHHEIYTKAKGPRKKRGVISSFIAFCFGWCWCGQAD